MIQSGASLTLHAGGRDGSNIELRAGAIAPQLVEQKPLDTDVGTYVGFPVRHPRSREPITLRRLLTHRGGLRAEQGDILARRESAALALFLARYVHATRAEAFLARRPGSR